MGCYQARTKTSLPLLLASHQFCQREFHGCFIRCLNECFISNESLDMNNVLRVMLDMESVYLKRKR